MRVNHHYEIIRNYYAKSIIGLTLSAFLILASLYQLEIILIRVTQDRFTFEFPFFLLTTNLWFARDIWYFVMILGWALGTYSGFKLGETREFEYLIETPSDVAIIKEIIDKYRQEEDKNN